MRRLIEVLRLEHRRLRRDEAEDDVLALRHVPQRLEIARAIAVVLHEEVRDVDVPEHDLADVFVAAAAHPLAAVVAAAHVHAERHALRRAGGDAVEDAGIGLEDLLADRRRAPSARPARADRRSAETSRRRSGRSVQPSACSSSISAIQIVTASSQNSSMSG